MTLLQEIDLQKRASRESLRVETRAALRHALKSLLPLETSVIVFGSLTLPGRFNRHSDVDVALTGEWDERRADRLAIDLEETLRRRVDLVVLDRCRLREKILRTGEKWTLLD